MISYWLTPLENKENKKQSKPSLDIANVPSQAKPNERDTTHTELHTKDEAQETNNTALVAADEAALPVNQAPVAPKEQHPEEKCTNIAVRSSTSHYETEPATSPQKATGSMDDVAGYEPKLDLEVNNISASIDDSVEQDTADIHAAANTKPRRKRVLKKT